MNFRKILGVFLIVGVLALLLGFVQRAPLANANLDSKKSRNVDQRPNILFIMSDDHAEQAIGAYGHPISQLAPTPNIDRIGKEGAVFKSCYVTNSICGPSRAVILTGKHSHINGFRANGDTFDGSQQTMPKILKNSGYQTAIVGKWHLAGEPTGFDYWKILVDQGNYYNPDFIDNGKPLRISGYATDIITESTLDWLQKKRDPNKPFMLMMQHKAPHRNWMPALRHLNKYDNVEFPVPDTYFDDYFGRRAAGKQEQNVYRDMFEGHDLKMSVEKGSDNLRYNPWTTDFERMTPKQSEIWKRAYRKKNDQFHDMNLSGKALAEWKLQRYLQDYLATIASVDEGVGKVLDSLEELGLAENTIVVYTTDQGFYLGEHGWFDKRFMYEESMKMPMLIRYPKVVEPGTVIDELVQNLDFAPTFLDIAGVKIDPEMQGRSLLPLLDKSRAFPGKTIDGENLSGSDVGEESVRTDTSNDASSWRNSLYYHYYGYPDFHSVRKHFGVKTKRYKLMRFYGHDIESWELFDLETDPKEMNNIYGKSGYEEITTDLKLELRRLQEKYKVPELGIWDLNEGL